MADDIESIQQEERDIVAQLDQARRDGDPINKVPGYSYKVPPELSAIAYRAVIDAITDRLALARAKVRAHRNGTPLAIRAAEEAYEQWIEDELDGLPPHWQDLPAGVRADYIRRMTDLMKWMKENR